MIDIARLQYNSVYIPPDDVYFARACETGDQEMVRALLDSGFQSEAFHLLQALEKRRFAIVHLLLPPLLQNRAFPRSSLSLQDEDGNTLLHLIAKHDPHWAVTRMLVQELSVEELSLKNNRGETPFHSFCAAMGNEAQNFSEEEILDVMQTWIRKVPPHLLMSQDNQGNTPLYRYFLHRLAFSRYTTKAVLALIHAMPEFLLAMQNHDGETCLQLSINTIFDQIAYALLAKLSNKNLLLADKKGISPLLVAARMFPDKICMTILSRLSLPERLSIRDAEDSSALHHLLAHASTLERFIAMTRAFPAPAFRIQNKMGRNAFQYALIHCWDFPSRAVAWLTPEVLCHQDLHDNNAMHIVARQIHLFPIALALLARLPRPAFEARNNLGRTPFFEAVDAGNIELIKALLQHPYAKHTALWPEKHGDTSLHRIIQGPSLYRFFKNNTSAKYPDIPLDRSLYQEGLFLSLQERFEIVQRIVDEYPRSLEIPNAKGDLPLHTAIDRYIPRQPTHSPGDADREIVRVDYQNRNISYLIGKMKPIRIFSESSLGLEQTILGTRNRDGFFPVQLALHLNKPYVVDLLKQRGVTVLTVLPRAIYSLKILCLQRLGVGIKPSYVGEEDEFAD